jgi:carbonic anhydrase
LDDVSHPFIKKLNAKDLGHIETINFSQLFHTLDEEDNKNKGFIHYKGSLTTPPCSDTVNWNIYSEVLPITENHLHMLHTQWHDNLGGHCNYREC